MFTIRTFVPAMMISSLSLFATAPEADQTIDLDPSITYQTIEGFGTYFGLPMLKRRAGENFWVDRPQDYEIDRYIKDLGVSAIRFNVPSSSYPAEGQPYDWTGAEAGDGGASHVFAQMRRYLERGTDRFVASVWSPPCWMKASGLCNGPEASHEDRGDNYLLPEYYDEFAAFLTDYCKAVRDSVGVELYALSVQNEPRFSQPYESCVYHEDELNRLVTLTGQKLRAAGLSTRIFGAEHMIFDSRGYDALWTNDYLHAYAMHGYQDGVDPNNGTAATWREIYENLDAHGKKVWMTETGGLHNSRLYTPLETATIIHAALGSGKVSLYTWWTYFYNLGTYVTTNGIPTKFVPGGTYYGSKHYFRFIRPGAQMIGCPNPATGLHATAFRNPDGTYAVVVINNSGQAKTFSVAGVSGVTWQKYQSYLNLEKCEHTGSSDGSSITIDQDRVMTLFSGDPIPELLPDTTADVVAAPPPTPDVCALNAHGDDILDLYLNGQKIQFGDDKMARVSVLRGENVIACKLINTMWGGGLIMSMLLPDGDTLRTDGTWKMSYKEPHEGWTSLGYDDSQWGAPTEMGTVDVWPGWENWGTSGVNIFHHKAQWITGALKTYFRNDVDIEENSTLIVRGNNVRVKMWVDGAFVKQTSGVLSFTQEDFGSISAGTHTIAFEVEDAAKDGNGVLFKCWAEGGFEDQIVVNTSWKCWFEEQSGWYEPGFDDSEWINPAMNRAYDSEAGVPWIYPNTFWYRKVFTSSEGALTLGTIVPKRMAARRTALAVEYYNVSGRKINVGRGSRSLGGTVLIRRAIMPKGASRFTKTLTVK